MSSSAPGPSPTNTNCALGFPSPYTNLFLPLCSLHRVQSPRSSRIFSKVSSTIFSAASNSEGPVGRTTIGPGGEIAGFAAVGFGLDFGNAVLVEQLDPKVLVVLQTILDLLL